MTEFTCFSGGEVDGGSYCSSSLREGIVVLAAGCDFELTRLRAIVNEQ
jgi:hypothetical protein